MGLVEFLKSVGGVVVPDEVIEQARQNDEDQKKKNRQRDQDSEATSNKTERGQ